MASVRRAQGRVEHVLPCASDERSDCHRAVRARHRRAGSGRGSCQAVTEGTLQSTESQTVQLPRPPPLPDLSQISPAVRDGDPVTFVRPTLKCNCLWGKMQQLLSCVSSTENQFGAWQEKE